MFELWTGITAYKGLSETEVERAVSEVQSRPGAKGFMKELNGLPHDWLKQIINRCFGQQMQRISATDFYKQLLLHSEEFKPHIDCCPYLLSLSPFWLIV